MNTSPPKEVAEHTPGPFTVGDVMADGAIPVLDDVNGCACIVALVQPNVTDGDKDHQKANAKLFAQAPVLLSTLHKLHANAAESPEWIRAVIDEALKTEVQS